MPFGTITWTGQGWGRWWGLGISPREGYFWGRIWVRHCNKCDFTAYLCDSASTIGAVVWGGACGWPRHCCIRWGYTSCKGNGRLWGFSFPIFTMENAIRSPMVKCFQFYARTWQHFRSANVSLESSICGLFGNVFTFKINIGIYEKLAKITIVLRKLHPMQ